MAVKTYQQGETVVIDADTTNRAGTATAPDGSITVVINDPTGTEEQAATAMEVDAAGDYHYNYTLASDAALGVWTYECVSTNAALVTIEGGRFNVVRRST